jgi:hypothetical protein
MRVDTLISLCKNTYMAMNPWITYQVASAQLDDLRRAAGVDRLAGDARTRGLLRGARRRLAGERRSRQNAGGG